MVDELTLAALLDHVALRQIFSLESASWTIAALLALFIVRMWNGAPAMFAHWVEWRKLVATAKAAEATRVAAEKASDWTRLRDEIIRLSEAERQCRIDFDALHRAFIDSGAAHASEVAALRSEIGELRGFLTGQGMARQEAAGVVAIERAERHKKEPPAVP